MIDHTKKLVQERFTTANSYKYDAEVRHCIIHKLSISLVVHSLPEETRAKNTSLSMSRT